MENDLTDEGNIDSDGNSNDQRGANQSTRAIHTLLMEMKAGVRNNDRARGEMAFCSRSPRLMRRDMPVPQPGSVAVTCRPDRSKSRLGELNMYGMP